MKDYSKQINYIKEANLKTDDGNYYTHKRWFDEDWEPIGPMLRMEMIKVGIIKEINIKGIDLIEIESSKQPL